MQFFIGIPNLQSELLISSRKNLQMLKVKWSEQVMVKEQAKGYGQILSFFCLLEPYPDLTLPALLCSYQRGFKICSQNCSVSSRTKLQKFKEKWSEQVTVKQRA